MSIGYAWITGRVIGPDGQGVTGAVIFTPVEHDWVGDLGGSDVVVTNRVIARLNSQGRFADAGAGPGIRVVAPASLPAGVHSYVVTLDTPGDPESPRRYRARILAGTTVDLTDIISGASVEDWSSPLAQPGEDGLLNAENGTEVTYAGDGLLTWRNDG